MGIPTPPADYRKGAICAAAKNAHLGKVAKLWLQDTGCGHDLVARKELKQLCAYIEYADIPMTFHSANGTTGTYEIMKLYSGEHVMSKFTYSKGPRRSCR